MHVYVWLHFIFLKLVATFYLSFMKKFNFFSFNIKMLDANVKNFFYNKI